MFSYSARSGKSAKPKFSVFESDSPKMEELVDLFRKYDSEQSQKWDSEQRQQNNREVESLPATLLEDVYYISDPRDEGEEFDDSMVDPAMLEGAYPKSELEGYDLSDENIFNLYIPKGTIGTYEEGIFTDEEGNDVSVSKELLNFR